MGNQEAEGHGDVQVREKKEDIAWMTKILVSI